MSKLKDVLISPANTSFADIEAMSRRAIEADEGQYDVDEGELLTATSNALESEAAKDATERDSFAAQAAAIKPGFLGGIFNHAAVKKKKELEEKAEAKDIEVFADKASSLLMLLLRERGAPESERAMGVSPTHWPILLSEAQGKGSVALGQTLKALRAETAKDAAFEARIAASVQSLQAHPSLKTGVFKSDDEKARLALFQSVKDRANLSESPMQNSIFGQYMGRLRTLLYTELKATDPAFAAAAALAEQYDKVGKPLNQVADSVTHAQAQLRDAQRDVTLRAKLARDYPMAVNQHALAKAMVPTLRVAWQAAVAAKAPLEAQMAAQQNARQPIANQIPALGQQASTLKGQINDLNGQLAHPPPGFNGPAAKQKLAALNAQLQQVSATLNLLQTQLAVIDKTIAVLQPALAQQTTKVQVAQMNLNKAQGDEAGFLAKVLDIKQRLPQLQTSIRQHVRSAQQNLLELSGQLTAYNNTNKPSGSGLTSLQFAATIDSAESFSIGDESYDDTFDTMRLAALTAPLQGFESSVHGEQLKVQNGAAQSWTFTNQAVDTRVAQLT